MTTKSGPQQQTAQRIFEELKLLEDHVPVRRRRIGTGEAVYQAGEPFTHLFVVNAGIFKIVNVSADGREQVAAIQFKGDWLGLNGIASGCYGCDAIAMDVGEVWAIRYDTLLEVCRTQPAVLNQLHTAMSREIGRDRDSKMALCTLSADARVADFLRYWTDALAKRGLRTDQITLHMSRAEIGNYLGLTVETVSRALSRLARGDVIRFNEKGRRDIQIPRIDALNSYIQHCLTPASAAIH
jgi:CRP/FNR family transcriptional regulator